MAANPPRLLTECLPPSCASGPIWTAPVPGYVAAPALTIRTSTNRTARTKRSFAGRPGSVLSGNNGGTKIVTMATPGAHIQEPNHADIHTRGRLPGAKKVVRIV